MNRVGFFYLLVGLVIGCASIQLRSATPEELRSLNDEDQDRLKPYKLAVAEAANLWHTAIRDLDLAKLDAEATSEKRKLPDQRVAWIDKRIEMASIQLDNLRLVELRRCQDQAKAQQALMMAEQLYKDAVFVQKRHWERAYEHFHRYRKAELDRTTISLVLSKKGIHHQHDQVVEQWQRTVESAKHGWLNRQVRAKAADQDVDAQKLNWQKTLLGYQETHSDACQLDWLTESVTAMPEPVTGR